MHLGGVVAELKSDACLHLPPHHRDTLLKATNQVVPRACIPRSRALRPQTHPPDA